MAWNVVIAGGGFGGVVGGARARAAAAEAVGPPDPRQRRQLPALHAVPARGGRRHAGAAARGHAAARHPPAHRPAPRRDHRPRPGGAHGRAARPTTARSSTLRYDQLLVALGSVSRSLPIPGLDRARDRLQEPRRRDLAAQPRRSRRSSRRTRPRTRRAARSCSPTSSSAAATPGSRRSPSSRTSPPTRWTATRGRGCTGCAGSWSRPTDRVLPEVPADLADYAVRELRGRGIDIRLETRLEEAAADFALLSTGERIPTRTLVWTAGVTPHPSLASLALPLDERGRVRVDEHMRVEGCDGVWAIGDCAAVPDPDRAPGAVPADGAARGPPGPRGRPQHRRRARRRDPPAAVRLPRPGVVRQPRPLQGGRQDRPPELPRLRRLVDGADLPHEPDSRASRGRSARSSTGPSGLPFKRDTAEVGSIGHPRPLQAEVYARGGSHRPLG